MEKLISDELLCSLGYTRTRIWSEHQKNFTLKYSIEGYDGQIDLIGTFCAPGALSPEEQIEKASSIEYLVNNMQGAYAVMGGEFHFVTIFTKVKLLELMALLKIEKVEARTHLKKQGETEKPKE